MPEGKGATLCIILGSCYQGAALMTLAEMRWRSVTLASRLQIARGQLNSALRTMDYERALTCQMEVDSVLSEIVDLSHRLRGSSYGDHATFARL